MLSIKHIYYFKVLEWFLFLGLCYTAAYFSHTVVLQFFRGSTSFAQSEQNITELPTITICFSAFGSYTKTAYEYGLDFKIDYLLRAENRVASTFLIEGKDTTLLGEILSFNKIISEAMGNCYKLSYISFKNPMAYEYSQLMIYFNQSIPWLDIPTLQVFFTTEKNSYGIAVNSWKNGRMGKTSVNKGLFNSVDVRAVKFSYLPENSKCGQESFYECFSRLLIANINGSLTKCTPGTFPNLPICKELNTDYWNDFWHFWNKVSKNGQCPKLCDTLDYTVETSSIRNEPRGNITFSFAYVFESSNSMTSVYEEYFIYDVTSMIGSVGGTLGMCIGFSFTGVLSSLMKFIQKGRMYINEKMYPHMRRDKI